MSQKHGFDDLFEVLLADTIESQKIHYNLRYQVYCDEMGFEDKVKFPERMEYDEWDEHSTHFIVRHRYSGQWLGALRLVRHYRNEFPFEKKCAPYDSLTAAQYGSGIEISRLCVVKEARRLIPSQKKGDDSGDFELQSGNIRYLNNYRVLNRSLMWGLIRAAGVYSAEHDFKQWHILVAPSLAYAIRKEGFRMTQIGSACEHKGQRTPYSLDVENVLANSIWGQGYQKRFIKYSSLIDQVPMERLSA